jgi:seryl-tRNA(Sec) selenium transferase
MVRGTNVTTNYYSWQDSFHAALLEIDWTKMQARIRAAEAEIHNRRVVLSQDHNGTTEEREALVDAVNSLRVLRMETDAWFEGENPGDTL